MIKPVFFAVLLACAAVCAAESGLDNARMLIKNGKPAEAAAKLRKLLAKQPENAEIKAALGLALSETGKDDAEDKT